jgi:hypothetical protein
VYTDLGLIPNTTKKKKKKEKKKKRTRKTPIVLALRRLREED